MRATSKPAKTAKTAKPVRTAKTAKTAKPVRTARPAKPVKTANKQPAAAPSRDRPLLSPAELRAAIDRLEEILAPLIARLGIEEAWRAATPASLENLGPLNYFDVKTRARTGMFAGLVGADAHVFGVFLDGSLRRSCVLYDLDPDELAVALSEPSEVPTLVVEPREYPRAARAVLDSGILGHHDGAVIAGERTPGGTLVHAIRPEGMTTLGTFLELAEQGVAALLPLQT